MRKEAIETEEFKTEELETEELETEELETEELKIEELKTVDLLEPLERRCEIKKNICKAVEGYTQWMQQHTVGIRAVNRWSHWYHGDSGMKRAQEILEMIRDEATEFSVIIEKVLKAFNKSGDNQHSLSRYLFDWFKLNVEDARTIDQGMLGCDSFKKLRPKFVRHIESFKASDENIDIEQGNSFRSIS